MAKFTKGQIANPKGRTIGSLSLVNILKKKLMEVPDGRKKTYADLLIMKILSKALEDEDTAMIRDVINRIDGMPRQPIAGDPENPLTIAMPDIRKMIVKAYGDANKKRNKDGN